VGKVFLVQRHFLVPFEAKVCFFVTTQGNHKGVQPTTIIGVRGFQKSPSNNLLTDAKEESRCRKFGTKISSANNRILLSKI
jgi:hypothetical protein